MFLDCWMFSSAWWQKASVWLLISFSTFYYFLSTNQQICISIREAPANRCFFVHLDERIQAPSACLHPLSSWFVYFCIDWENPQTLYWWMSSACTNKNTPVSLFIYMTFAQQRRSVVMWNLSRFFFQNTKLMLDTCLLCLCGHLQMTRDRFVCATVVHCHDLHFRSKSVKSKATVETLCARFV